MDYWSVLCMWKSIEAHLKIDLESYDVSTLSQSMGRCCSIKQLIICKLVLKIVNILLSKLAK